MDCRIRNVPPDVWQNLKIQCALEKVSMNAKIIEIVSKAVKGPMSSKDRAQFIMQARRNGTPLSEVAEALGVDPAAAAEFFAKRSVK